MSEGQDPDGHSSQHSVHGPAGQLVLHGESHTAVALDADAHQQPRAAVDAAVEAIASEGTEHVPQGPEEIIRRLNHLEGQQQQQQEVRQRQAEQEDVDGCRVGLADAPHEGPQRQEVGRETKEKRYEVDEEKYLVSET